MRKIIFFLIIGLIIQSKLNAQATYAELENNRVVYPSPTAASLGKYGEYPVKLYNGMVNIGQDIVTVKSGHLALNVSLSYHASGNRPSDIPGWVGLGFSLNAGGVITRVIKDLPDDYLYGFYYSNTSVQYYWNNYPNTHFVEQYYNGQLDPRSDMYQFNFCGKTGEFVFDWNRNIHFKQKAPFKVEVINNLLDGFQGFVITTDDGTMYTFTQTERSVHFAALGVPNSPATSWYLTKIKNLSGDSIVLKYTNPTNKYRFKQYSAAKEVVGSYYDPATPGNPLVTGPTYTLNTSVDEVVYLDEIDFGTGKLLFGKSTRMDPLYNGGDANSNLAEEKKLSFITLNDNNNNAVKQWKFEYFENSTERLKLKNLIVQTGNQTDVQKYSFEYNIVKLPLPFPGPKPANPYLCNDVDYWGYWNGMANGDNKIPKLYLSDLNQYFGSANRSTINTSLVKAEMLEKINYPTGGYTTFQYESNDYAAQGPSFAADQNPMYEPTVPESYGFEYDRDAGGFDVDPATLSFVLTEPTHVNITYSCGADGPQHAWANPGTAYNLDLNLPAGTHDLRGLLQTDLLLQPASADITRAHAFVTVYKKGVLIPVQAKVGPGLRIKSIETNDGISSTTRSFEYKLEHSTTMSSGFLSVFPAFATSLQRIASNIFGVYISSEPINDIGEGAPIGYSRVVERFQDNSYIVHRYTTYGDYPDETMSFLNGYSNSQLAHMTSNDFWRGLETGTDYYNAAGIIQKRISNSFQVLPGSETNVQAIELKQTVSIIDGSSTNNVNGTLESLYYIKSCFLYNNNTIEEIFDKDGGNPIGTTVYKYYDNVAHLQPTRVQTSASDGSVLTTTTSFPDDFAPGVPFIDYMQANHFTSFPIEQVVYRQRGDVTNIVSGNIITYKTEGAGLPEQLFKLETAGPIPQASFKFSNRSVGVLPPSSLGTQYSPDAHYKLALAYTKFDNRGNPLESIKRNGIKTSYLWGYNQEFPVAEIAGTDYTTALSKITNQAILNSPTGDAVLRTELNNLRVNLPSAMVTTYTYAPLIGMTSQTDPSGKTIYYEYDGFGRLKLMRDQNNAIIKRFDYKYTGQ
ncbi:hypothetical protein ACI6Q2_23155 [Chitinophagaceae bacterium LWZ2-11]